MHREEVVGETARAGSSNGAGSTLGDSGEGEQWCLAIEDHQARAPLKIAHRSGRQVMDTVATDEEGICLYGPRHCSRGVQVSQMEVTPGSHSTPNHATWHQKDRQLPVLGILHLYLPAASSTVSIFILFRPPGSHVIKLKGPGGSSLAYALAGGTDVLTASRQALG